MPSLQLNDEPIRPFDRPSCSLGQADFTILINVRQSHETPYAIRSVRTASNAVSAGAELARLPSADPNPQSKPERRQLLKLFNEVMKQHTGDEDGKGSTSGLARNERWTGQHKTGNAGNAAFVSMQRAQTVRLPLLLSLGCRSFTHRLLTAELEYSTNIAFRIQHHSSMA